LKIDKDDDDVEIENASDEDKCNYSIFEIFDNITNFYEKFKKIINYYFIKRFFYYAQI